MPSQTVRSGESAQGAGRERLAVIVIAVGIVSVIAVYLALNATKTRDTAQDLLPYQTLARTLPEADQRTFRAIREGLLSAEAERARRGAWPEQAPLGPGYRWSRVDQGAIINYFGAPSDPSAPAWLLEIQEPEPGMLPDPAPADDEHHRLPDGTMLHTYVWMHRYGSQVPVGFVRQPQNSGWIEVFSTPPNPVYYNRR
jgi:type II secretory pathway pseudopilin PulG